MGSSVPKNQSLTQFDISEPLSRFFQTKPAFQDFTKIYKLVDYFCLDYGFMTETPTKILPKPCQLKAKLKDNDDCPWAGCVHFFIFYTQYLVGCMHVLGLGADPVFTEGNKSIIQPHISFVAHLILGAYPYLALHTSLAHLILGLHPFGK